MLELRKTSRSMSAQLLLPRICCFLLSCWWSSHVFILLFFLTATAYTEQSINLWCMFNRVWDLSTSYHGGFRTGTKVSLVPHQYTVVYYICSVKADTGRRVNQQTAKMTRGLLHQPQERSSSFQSYFLSGVSGNHYFFKFLFFVICFYYYYYY